MATQGEPRSEQQVVEFLRKLLTERIPLVRCEYDPECPFAYAYPLVQDFFGMGSAEAVELLEELVLEGVLDRRLADKVHLCPDCGWHTLNFVETCPRCRSIDIEIESVIHHFACAYVGPWSEFRRGTDLICPKCDEKLRHMGMDYEKPSDTYRCRSCGYVFTESRVETHCFPCKHQAKAEQVQAHPIYEYAPNSKTNRAVQLGRVHGLDIKSVVFDDSSRTFRQDFLVFEIDREVYRARRYHSPLSLVLVEVHGIGRNLPDKDAVDVARLEKQVFEGVAAVLRDLDVVSAVSEAWAAVLLPETSTEGAVKVAQRLQAIVSDFQAVSLGSALSVSAAVAGLLPEHETGQQFLDHAYEVFRWTLKSRSGTIVTTDEWRKEARHE